MKRRLIALSGLVLAIVFCCFSTVSFANSINTSFEPTGVQLFCSQMVSVDGHIYGIMPNKEGYEAILFRYNPHNDTFFELEELPGIIEEPERVLIGTTLTVSGQDIYIKRYAKDKGYPYVFFEKYSTVDKELIPIKQILLEIVLKK